MKDFVILGASGFAKEVRQLSEEIRAVQPGLPAFRGYIAGESPAGLPLLGDDAWGIGNLEPTETAIVIAVGAPLLRRQIALNWLVNGFRPLSLLHPSVQHSESIALGRGVIFCAGARFTVDTTVGDFCVVNLNATVGHDCRLGDFSTVHPGANLSGGVEIGEAAEVGTGAVLLPGVKAGAGAVLGAGGVATRDLEAGKTYTGIPALPTS